MLQRRQCRVGWVDAPACRDEDNLIWVHYLDRTISEGSDRSGDATRYDDLMGLEGSMIGYPPSLH